MAPEPGSSAGPSWMKGIKKVSRVRLKCGVVFLFQRWGAAWSSSARLEDVLSCPVVSGSLRSRGPKSAKLLCPWGFCRQEYCSGWALG